MKKFFLTLAATAVCTTAFAAVGDVTTILDQTFEEGTMLTNGSNYSWGSDIQDMITANGVLMTNGNNKDNGYENRPFLTFPPKAPIGDATNAVEVSYTIFNNKGKQQAATYFEINFFDGKNKFLFGIKEGVGDNWGRPSYIVTTDAEDNKSEAKLPENHLKDNVPAKDNGQGDVNLTVKFSGETAIIEIDGGSYPTYCNKEGLTAIKLSVSGGQDYDRGVCIKNFTIKTEEVAAVETANYTLKYVCGSETIKEVSKAGTVGDPVVINEDEKAPLWNEDKTVKYLFVSDDAAGKTIAAGEVVTLTYRQAANWDYIVTNNVNDDKFSGTCIEGESVEVPFSIYALKADGSVWTKKNSTNPWFADTFTPDANNYVGNIEYTEAEEITNGLYFFEAENVPGLTKTTDSNADIRCSNQAGGYIAVAEGEEAQPVEICKLKKGTYKVYTAVRGGAGATITIKYGNETAIEVETDGNWRAVNSEEFTIDEETSLTVEGATKSKYVDFFLITGEEGGTTAVEAIEAVKDGKWYNLQGVQVAQPTVKGLYIHNGKKVIVK